MTTPVLAAPHFDPGAGRIDLTLPSGMTLANIVNRTLPNASPEVLAHVRVALVTERGAEVVEQRFWGAVRPRKGVRVVIRVIPAGDKLRSILTIVVSVAAIALGQFWGPGLANAIGVSDATGIALATMGLQVIGSLLINALIPPPRPEEKRDSYQIINGWQNRLDPDGAVPCALGSTRYAPPFAAFSHSEIVGDWHYVRAAFNFGYGPVKLSDFRLGETPLSEFDEVTIETREGRADDAPLSLYPRQIVEESIGVELARAFPRNDYGDIVSGPAELTPAVRVSGADASGATVLLSFPAGLVHFNKKGKKRSSSVEIRIRQRLAGTDDWIDVTEIHVVASKLEGFYRQHHWTFPQRGRWEVEVTRLTNESTDSSTSDKSHWAALQTHRPEYPLNFAQPLALAAVRVKATHQLNGQLDNLSAIVSRVCLDYDHITRQWIERETSNPAALYRYALQSPANPRRVGNSGIDLAQIEDWHDYCRLKGLTYRRVLDQTGATLAEALAEIARAGRASPRHDGMRWGVVIDRPQELIVDHIHPRNSWGFKATRQYVQPPHAFRVPFIDETHHHRRAEMFVRWPGYDGPITLTEAMEQPGKTDPAEVWRETRRRMYEAIHRPDSYEVMQDGAARVATRGDLVALSHDVLDDVQVAARVKSVHGSMIVLDEEMIVEAGRQYAIRFRQFGPSDTIGSSVVTRVSATAGATQTLLLTSDGPHPQAGDMVLFGCVSRETFPMIVTGIEMTEDQAALLRLVDAAPQIEQVTDSEIAPAWSGRAGVEVAENFLAPAAPRFAEIRSGVEGTDEAGLIQYRIVPGAGVIAAASYLVRHRVSGATGWTEITISAASGGGSISGYESGDVVELQAVSRSFAGVDSPPSATVTVTVGASDAPIPVQIDPGSVLITPLLGGARVDFAVGDDPAVVAVQVYRATTPELDRAVHAAGAPVAVQPSRLATALIGDTTRRNLLASADFSSTSPWLLGAGWSITGGAAVHTAGSAGLIRQPVTLTAGRWYRAAFTLTASAGAVTPRVGSASGTARSSSGRWSDRIQAPASATEAAWSAASNLAGQIDNVVLFEETTACLSAGTHYIWLEPINDDDQPGPVSGPFTVTIE